MPRISKQTLSQFLKTECYRQLKFILSPHENKKYELERTDFKIPPRQDPRPGITLVAKAGQEWEKETYKKIQKYFNDYKIVGNKDRNGDFTPIQLSHAIDKLEQFCFIMQPEYQMEVNSAFEKTFNIDQLRILSGKYSLELSKLRPDILLVVPPMTYDHYVDKEGHYKLVEKGCNKLQIKIIDIKNTSEPSIAHFSEIAYYMITLASWLDDQGLNDKFQVVSGAIWPGSYEVSAIKKKYDEYNDNEIQISNEDLLSWLYEDIIEAPFEVFVPKIYKFFNEDLPYVLKTDWTDMDYHVNASCKHCDYLGYPWKNKDGDFTYDENHCMRLALKEDHLSRITDMTKAAKESLIDGDVEVGSKLSIKNEQDKIFDRHQTLKSKRVLYPKRAESLIENKVIIPDNVGTSSIMPKWSDLSIFITVDFDITSAITGCIGIKGVWVNTQDKKDLHFWPSNSQKAKVYVIEAKDIEIERENVIKFLEYIQTILNEVRKMDKDSTYQIYIWDSTQYNHIKRVIGRNLNHIILNPKIKDLIWLFPSEETIGNPSLQRQSPITIVKDCISSLTALPIPHYYSLLETARTYGNPDYSYVYNVHPLFEDALSDQIPSERIHEIWSKIKEPYLDWVTQMGVLQETVIKRVNALHAVTQKIQKDIRSILLEYAPSISKPLPPSKQGKMCYFGELIYMYSKLEAKLSELEILSKRALPIYEREAKFDSAILIKRIEDKKSILRSYKIVDSDYIYVYKMSENSKDVRIKEGDFSVAVSPNCDASFLGKKIYKLLDSVEKKYFTFQTILSVTVKIINREEGILIFEISPCRCSDGSTINPISELESLGISFAKNVSLDPVANDFFTTKLKEALQEIGNPPNAIDNITEIEQEKQSGLSKLRPRKTSITPASKLLWDIDEYQSMKNIMLKDRSEADIIAYINSLKKTVKLNDSQIKAWNAALNSNISMIWGPPGTGKSRTLITIVKSFTELARMQNKVVRILITAFTYNAIDNVLIDVADEITDKDIYIKRLCSATRKNPACKTNIQQIISDDKAEMEKLRHNLEKSDESIIVGAPPQQIHKLLTKSRKYQHEEYFDIIIIDEASQMNVASSILAFSSLVMNGALILAGDGLQLPPIHKADMPVGCESKLGSIYDYYERECNVSPSMLEVNYRSNREIVDFIKEAGYKDELISYSPGMKIRLVQNDMDDVILPEGLCKDTSWEQMIDPNKKICCFTYHDGMSSQWNEFEVEAIATLCGYLKGNLYSQLANEKDINNKLIEETKDIYTDVDFWVKGIGIVTPHRAQQSKVSNRLERLFSYGDLVLQEKIRNCVDTVERFQGQQRDVIIVSFALGDVDMIANEEEFILNLNRFNVMISRARAKVIVLISEELSYYLANDMEVLRQSRLLNKFANTYCENKISLSLPYIKDGTDEIVQGTLKYM